MPRGDGTGPNGMGPMTGRAAGYCAGYSVPGYANPSFGRGGWGRGRGWGGGRGAGRGWRGGYYAADASSWAGAGYGNPAFAGQPYAAPYAPQLTTKQERDILKDQAQMLKQELEDIQSRISTLEKAEKTK